MAIRLAVLSVGAIIIASLAFSTHSGLANAQQNKTSMQPSLTVEQARRIVAPLYEALNEPTKKDVPALLANAANPDYKSCSTNSDCLSRDQLAGVFTTLGKIIPDLHWTIKEIWTSGNRIVVRGEATGTPTGREELQDDLDRHVHHQGQQASDGLSRGELDGRHGADQVERSRNTFSGVGNVAISNSYAYIISCH
jgi:hypothetical protein